jgi:tetratricopeptide (TPR) repeat protein
MNLLTPAEIARQIRVGADVLTVSLPDLPARHRSLRSVFEYSWILLNEEEKRDLRYLSVFRGGFERDAARQYGVSLPTLNALTDKSLLQRSPETGRYDLPAMVRRFASDKLAERPTEQTNAYQSHTSYYLQFLQTRESQLLGERQQAALREIDIEMGNVHAAWQWATSKQDKNSIGLGLEALFHFYQLRGRQQEGADEFSQAGDALHDQADIVLAKTLARLGAYYRVLGRLDDARQQLQESLQLARDLKDSREIAFSLCQLGIAHVADPEARAYLEESLALAEDIRNKPIMAESLNWLAFTYYQEGDLETAVQMLERSLAIGRELKAMHGLAVSLTNLGIIYGHRGQDDKAQQVLKEALQSYKRLNDLHGMAAACNNLCYIALNAQNYRAARIWAEQALANQREVGDKRGIGDALGHLSEIAFYQADYEQSRTICHEGITVYQEIGLSTSPFFNLLGRIALAEADYETAREAFQKALAQTPVAALSLNILTGFAVVMAHDGLFASAASLLIFIEQHPTSEPLVKERALSQLADIRIHLKSEQYQAAQLESREYSLIEWIELAKNSTSPLTS